VQPPGGGDGVGAWTVQALQRDCEVGLLTWVPFDAAEANAYFGTAIDPTRVRAFTVPGWLRRALDLFPVKPLPTLYKSILLAAWRYLLSHRYDRVVSTHSEMDFGCRGVQYVHFPQPLEDLSYVHGHWTGNRVGSALLSAYRWLCGVLAGGWRLARLRANLTLVNSEYTARKFEAVYGVRPRVLYPPAVGRSGGWPWEERRSDFLCLGRICPSKRLEDVIAILAAVRARGHEVHLHLVGSHESPSYSRMLLDLAAPHRAWIHVPGVLGRAEVEALMARTRYGIHAMREEHFGMAVAEMVRAGCVVFVPDGGGQVEVVDDPRLQWHDPEQAVDRICSVLSDPETQRDLARRLAARADLWSADRFMAEMRDAVLDLA
jgi:glycosyltransferase involved in cell wall biosynthesis